MKRTVYIGTRGKGYHYDFTCMECNAPMEIIAGEGRKRCVTIPYDGKDMW